MISMIFVFFSRRSSRLLGRQTKSARRRSRTTTLAHDYVTVMTSDRSTDYQTFARRLSDFDAYERRNSLCWLELIACLVGVVLLVLWSAVRGFCGTDKSPLAQSVETDFRRPIEQTLNLAVTSPLTVSIFERSNVGVQPPGNKFAIYEMDSYNERLIVIRPNNWLVYTFNGITFHYIVNNVNRNRTRCKTANGLNAIEYRLRTRGENNKKSFAYDLRFTCVHYTLDQLVRLFNTTANRTDVDVTDYFDRKKFPLAPKYSVYSVLELLVVNRMV